ncbi:MAG: ABC transporter permease [Cellulophaga sp.]
MLKHNLNLFFRNIGKHKSTFVINVLGMSTGLACALLIAIWAMDELSIDRFHEKGDRLVQILQNLPTANGIETDDITQGPLAEALVNEFPEVEQTVSVLDNSWFEGEKFLLTDGGDKFFGSNNQFASKDYFSIFSYPLIHGSPNQVLANTNGVVISEVIAKKLFQTTDAIGKTIEWIHDEYGGTYTVSGVFKELPKKSTVQFDAVFHMDVFLAQNDDLTEWNNSDLMTYAVLESNASLNSFNNKIEGFLQTKGKNFPETYFAQVYGERYLRGNYENGVVSGGRIEYVYLFSLIALLILIIACINFINMATAKASTRIKEIGVKKSVGAQRKGLMIQFTAESLVTASISMVFALFMVALFLPQFNVISGKEMVLAPDTKLVVGIFSITIGTGVIAGIYPALYLSSLSVLNGLKGKLVQNKGGHFIRKSLVVFQFSTAVVLIASVLIVYKQMSFIHKKNLGFNKEQIIWFSSGVLESNMNTVGGTGGLSVAQIESFLQILKNTPGVVNASNFRHTMMADFGTTTGVNWAGKNENQNAQFAQISGGYDFIETMQMQLKEGRLFSRDFKAEREKIIFNEAAIEQMGMKNPIGKVISLWGEDKEIVGVVKDFHVDKMYNKVMPVFMKLDDNNFASNIMVRLEPNNTATAIERVKEAYQNYFIKGAPFDFKFLNDNYQALYEGEKRVAELSKYFAGLAMLISCLGLFGLTAFTAEQRKKEIGVRKVLGASIMNIAQMLSKDFLKLVMIALVLGFPIAYWLMNDWLQTFAYRINIGWETFLIAGVAALLIALFTVSFQSIRAALMNPVKSLRSE